GGEAPVARPSANDGVRLSPAAIDAIADCLTYESERAWSSYYRYLSWVNPQKGPTGHESHIYGLYSVSDPKNCAEKLAAAERTGGPLPEGHRYVAALRSLADLTGRADVYYDSGDWKDDRMAKGKQLHKPLMDAYGELATADRGLRALLDADADARDRAAL